MRIVVVGSAGRTGRLTVAEAAARGHEVVALVRRPPEHPWPAGVTTTIADVEEPLSLPSALAGADAIVSAVGSGSGRRETTVYSRGTEHLCDAMWSAGVRRLVVVSAVPVGPPGAAPDRLVRTLLHAFFGGTYRDMARMEALLADRPDVDATVVRPPRLVGGPVAGYRRAEDSALPRVSRISRADLAVELVDQAERSDAAVPRCVTVAH